MAFVHHHDRTQLADDLQKRRFRGAGEECVPLPERLRKRQQVPVLLIDLPVVLLDLARPDRRVAEHADAQVLRHVPRFEVLAGQKLFLRVDVHPAAEIPVESLPVGMNRIGKVQRRLRQDRVAGHEPHDELRLSRRQPVEETPHRAGRKEGLSAARRHLDADVRDAAEVVAVARHPVPVRRVHRDALPLPESLPRRVDSACPVQRGEIVREIVEDAPLIALQFHRQNLRAPTAPRCRGESS